MTSPTDMQGFTMLEMLTIISDKRKKRSQDETTPTTSTAGSGAQRDDSDNEEVEARAAPHQALSQRREAPTG